ncbi:hypothetical protein [Stakelama marina]|uniref:Uncharacterized protein n=1 Tax=Stakelama marina TaxID=2826939 RepID=A0A8T4IBD7_9SPHN|nr:hypothetical protein [Stakelama marina]MBR0551733.1 hypothetical protein [Stakelama marina]
MAERFVIADLDKLVLSDRARDAMLDLVLAWAHLDGALSMWVGARFGIAAHKNAILLGRSDGKSKLLKLQNLYRLDGEMEVVREIKKIRRAYEQQVGPRNTVAHASCRGSLKSDPEMIVFATYEATAVGELAVDTIPIAKMVLSTKWAHRLSVQVHRISDMLVATDT